MTMVAVEFPEPVHYIAAGFGPQEPNRQGNRPNTRPRITSFPQTARRVDVHEA